MTRTCTVRCHRCLGTFTAPNRLKKHCPKCREIRKAERIEQRKSYKPDRDKPVVPPRPRVRKKAIQAVDFMLILAEAKAELAKQENQDPAAFYVPSKASDEFALSSLKQPRRRSA